MSTWYSRESFDDGITCLTEPGVHPLLRSNVWHVRGRDQNLLIDTGLGVASLREDHPDLFEREPILVLTHGHLDHVGNAHEFTTRLIHPSEMDALAEPPPASLLSSRYPQSFLDQMVEQGLPPFGETLLDRLPFADYDATKYRIQPAPATGSVEEGDLVSLGDREFLVLHLPGHSPGSLGLLEKETGTLFSGDAVYDEPLLDELKGSSIPDYLATMQRLQSLDVQQVHAGHAASFDRARLLELTQAYIEWRS